LQLRIRLIRRLRFAVRALRSLDVGTRAVDARIEIAPKLLFALDPCLVRRLEHSRRHLATAKAEGEREAERDRTEYRGVR
jgi:hypothetical protein